MSLALGALLAGGAGTRFGGVKLLARVGGTTLLERASLALQGAVPEVVLISSDASLHVPGAQRVPDDEPGQGPLGGIATALRLAGETGRRGALCLAADMPFVTASLLQTLLAAAADHPNAIVVPESTGRRGMEPLCAFYPVSALPSAKQALRNGRRSPHLLLDELESYRYPLDGVRAIGDPEQLFFNVNTREELARAERIAAG